MTNFLIERALGTNLPGLLTDASHAWVSIHVPGTGWVDDDPTNHSFAGVHHIVVARGRDYSDISPTKGIFSGGGSHTFSTAVTVARAGTVLPAADGPPAKDFHPNPGIQGIQP